jgi:UDP-N-acetylmuramyl pentapeptide synthase
MPLLLADLADITHGQIHLGRMPPLAGQWAAIERIVFESRLVEPGDLFWRLPVATFQLPGSAQHALLRGAAGLVVGAGEVAAWPGTFCLEVDDPVSALERLEEWLRLQGPADQRAWDSAEKNRLELKDLQLCRYLGLDKTPPTCGRPGGERFSACRRAA